MRKLKILIDIGHPAHVHIFRNLAKELEKNGNEVLFTCRVRESSKELLRAYSFHYISFGPPFKNRIGKLWGLAFFNIKMLHTLLKFKPSITLGHGSMYAAQMSWLLGIPHISVEDTGNMEQIHLYRPFAKSILVPVSFHKNLGSKQLMYAGNHELAYLHPNRFSPDKSVLTELNILPGESFTIVRFVAWNASHDIGHQGISLQNKLKAINEFSKYAKVFISSEKALPPELESFRLKTSPERIHDVIAFASLLYGESATMASEAAMLGVPGIFVNDTYICYTREEEEKYGLVFNYSESEQDQEISIAKGIELLSREVIKEEWQQKRKKMLEDKIDVTSFLVWFVENWPESMKIMKKNPDYQNNFK
jgi:uncharacterized protein